MEDQVRLWEMERDRLVYQEGVLYNQFLSQQDFELLRDYAQVDDCPTIVAWCVLLTLGFFLLGTSSFDVAE